MFGPGPALRFWTSPTTIGRVGALENPPDGATRTAEQFVVGVDLGQAADFTAIGILEKIRVSWSVMDQPGFEPPRLTQKARNEFHVRHLQRLRLGTRYPEITEIVGVMFKALPERQRKPTLVVDNTGVGRPVVDAMRETGLRPIALTITGGNEENSPHSDAWNVPKKNLVSSLVVLLQSGRLKISAQLPEAETLISELMNFRMRISNAGHESFGAWRESIHDDLVLACAVAAWFGQRKVVEPQWAYISRER